LAINNYLVIGVNPSNNETNVSVNTEVVVTFSQYMDASTITSSNVVLKEVNGDIVISSVKYDSTSMTATLIPNYSSQLGMAEQSLNPGKEYEITVVGGTTGVKTITGDYMGVSRTYQFTTAYVSGISVPQDITVVVNDGYPTVSWIQPKSYDISTALTYEVMVSTSNDPLVAPVWPSAGDINKVSTTVLNVPKKFSDGNYYAYVRAINGDQTSDWVSSQFNVQTAVTPTPSPGGSAGGGDIFSFDVADTYPRRDDADIMPEQILIVFSSDVDPTTVNNGTVYIVKKQDKATLSLVDFMTDYAPAKAVAATIAPIVTPNVVVLTATLEQDAEYTVIVRESVKSSTGASLGIAYHWSFVTTYSTLYGDADLVRQDLGSFAGSTSDKLLYAYLNESSKYAYQIVSNAQNFDANNYKDGAAPYEVHQYVRFRTAYDLLLNSQMRSGGGGATQAVTLGDLTVTKAADQAGSISGILAELQSKMKLYMDLMQGQHNRGYAKPLVAIRGENVEAYPSYMTRDAYKALS
jgi:hypothetical protein